MKTLRLRDCPLFRFVVIILLPLCVLLWGASMGRGYYTGMLCTLGINVILAASLNLVNGFSGMFSMGHAAFMAVGAYVSAFLTLSPAYKASALSALPEWVVNLQIPIPAALVFSGLLAAALALLIGIPVLRFKGHYLSVATLGLIVIVRAVLDNSDEYTNGPRGITGLSGVGIGIIYLVMVLALFVMYRLLKTNYGRGLVAMRDDQVAAQALGINLTVKKISVFCISAFIAGVGGALWGHNQSVISGQFFYFDASFRIVQTSIIGGMYSLSGAVVGALFMTFVPEFLSPLESGFSLFGFRLPDLYGVPNIMMAVFLVVLIIFRRQGIVGYSEMITETMFSKDTYTSIFKKQEYMKVAGALRALPGRISGILKK
jgi:branched-chain amino acid transport system permease protein